MRLEKKRQEELARRKGSTGRTIIQGIWLFISFAVAYFLANYLFDQGYISYNMFYNQLSLSRDVPEWALLGGVMLLVVVIMQFFLYVGFALGSPEGRRRTGDATLSSRTQDPFDGRGY